MRYFPFSLGAFKYYVIMFLTFLDPPTHVFDDLQYIKNCYFLTPPTHLFDDVILGWSLIKYFAPFCTTRLQCFALNPPPHCALRRPKLAASGVTPGPRSVDSTVIQNAGFRLEIGFEIWSLETGHLCLIFISKGQFCLQRSSKATKAKKANDGQKRSPKAKI